ncbi:hypothetical protein AB0C71_00920 [Streptomyces anulatus]|uniref:hypothetical protein n=1 Tax=Streptomyces anulatus TaxID=1892 RepID=UPI0033D4CDC6
MRRQAVRDSSGEGVDAANHEDMRSGSLVTMQVSMSPSPVDIRSMSTHSASDVT